MARLLSEQEILRRESLSKLKALGIDPYPAAEYKCTHFAKDIRAGYSEGASGFEQVRIAGRLMTKRIMGKASFAVLADSSGDMQIYINRDEICPDEDKTLYNDVFKKLLDIGDFIGVEGHMFTTQTGEMSLHVKSLTVLSKSLRPLPVVKTDADGKVYDALTDPEIRYRQRYVDLVVNPGVKEIFRKRNKVISTMRRIFDDAGYMEVETPILQPIPGGAAARPFITHHNA
jgi:lysyl-tRNA synthetase class 2